MFRHLFAPHSPILNFTLLSLAIFLAIFALVLLRTFGRRAKDFDAVASLPLHDDERSLPVATSIEEKEPRDG